MPSSTVPVQGQTTLRSAWPGTLLFGPLHGHGITKHIQRTSEDVLQVEHGSLYPALYRLENNGCITSKWEQAANGREMRLYRLTAKRRKQLTAEESKWNPAIRIDRRRV